MNQENFCSLMINQFIWRVIPIFTGEQLVPIERGWRDTNAMVEPCLNPDSNKTTVRRHFWDSWEHLNMDWVSTNIKELQMIIFRGSWSGGALFCSVESFSISDRCPVHRWNKRMSRICFKIVKHCTPQSVVCASMPVYKLRAVGLWEVQILRVSV